MELLLGLLFIYGIFWVLKKVFHDSQYDKEGLHIPTTLAGIRNFKRVVKSNGINPEMIPIGYIRDVVESYQRACTTIVKYDPNANFVSEFNTNITNQAKFIVDFFNGDVEKYEKIIDIDYGNTERLDEHGVREIASAWRMYKNHGK